MGTLVLGLALLALAACLGAWLNERAITRRTETAEVDEVIQSMREWLGVSDNEVFIKDTSRVIEAASNERSMDEMLLSVEAEEAPINFEWQPGPGLMKELSHVHVNGKCVKRRYGVGPCNRGWK